MGDVHHKLQWNDGAVLTLSYRQRYIAYSSLADSHPPLRKWVNECGYGEVGGTCGHAMVVLALLLGNGPLNIRITFDDNGVRYRIREHFSFRRILKFLFFLPLDLARGGTAGRSPIGWIIPINTLIRTAMDLAYKAHRDHKPVDEAVIEWAEAAHVFPCGR